MQAFFQITITSILSVILFSGCFALILAILLKNIKVLSRIKYEILLVCIAAPIIKILMPMEIIPWSININVPYVLPELVKFVNLIVFTIGERAITLWEIVIAVFIMVAIIKILVLLGSYVKFMLGVRNLPETADSRIPKLVEKILAEEGKDVVIPVKNADWFNEPTVFGVFTPTVLMPDIELSDKELECVLRHEIAHYLHGDLVIRFIWLLIKAICWWNPIVGILEKQLEKLLEIRADENALRNKDAIFVNEFLQTLVMVDVLTTGKKRKPIFGVSFLGKGGLGVKTRIALVMERKNRSRQSIFLNTFATTFCVVIIAVAMNCFIFEPKGELPEADVVKTQMVTEQNSFLIKNADGTYDMYYNGKYRLTVGDDMGSCMPIYENLEEAMEYEEIQ